MGRALLLGGILGLVVVGTNACGDDDATVQDAAVVDAAREDGGADATSGDAAVDPDGSPCTHDGALGDPCSQDCDCQTALACRGLPGQTACAVPCATQQDCASAPLGCSLISCEINLGACRCQCETGECGDDVCFGTWCVGCARDEDCAGHACGSTPGLDTPRCRAETGVCECGGTCGDGVCDPVEEQAQSCPADCSTCAAQQSLVASCSDGTRVDWCACDTSGGAGVWDCQDPWAQCPGDTRCAQEGGFCTAAAVDCMEGTVAATALGCEGQTPLCCAADPCTEAGGSYYPASGRCCAGLRAITSLAPMTGMYPDLTGPVCYPGCWAMTCAPCGDGTCQLHFGENACNCPEDCPLPPSGLVCDTQDLDCGRPFCQQQGAVCHQETPRCNGGQCTRDVQDVSGAVCDRITDTCVVP